MSPKAASKVKTGFGATRKLVGPRANAQVAALSSSAYPCGRSCGSGEATTALVIYNVALRIATLIARITAGAF
jgi:hypothetical protein